MGWSKSERLRAYQDDQGVNKFIQSFIETNWLTDDDDDDDVDEEERDMATAMATATAARQSGCRNFASFNLLLSLPFARFAILRVGSTDHPAGPPLVPACLRPSVACQRWDNFIYLSLDDGRERIPNANAWPGPARPDTRVSSDTRAKYNNYGA